MSTTDGPHRAFPAPPRTGERGVRRRAPRLPVMAALAAVLLLAPGCQLLFQEPVVRILQMELRDVGLTSATAQVRVEVENPNWFELDVLGFDYELDLSDPGQGSTDRGQGSPAEPTWVTLASGYHGERLTVPAGGSREAELEVPFDYEGMGAAVRSFLAGGTIPYRLGGEVEGRLLFWTVDFPFQAEGAVDMS